jgi:hypothetical protein
MFRTALRFAFPLCTVLMLFGCHAGGTAPASVDSRTLRRPEPSPSPTPVPTTAPSSASYASTVLTDKPVAFYPLADTAPAVMTDTSGHGLNGNYGGGTAATNTIVLHQPGVVGNDTGFGAGFPSGAWLASSIGWAPNNALLKPTAAVSVEAWVQPRAPIPVAAPIVSFGDNVNAPQQPYALTLDSAGTNKAVFMVAVGGAQRSVTSQTQLQAGTTYHLLGTYDGTTLSIYVNGVRESTQAAAGTIGHYDSTNGLAIGGRYMNSAGLSSIWSGTLEDVAIYGGALSATQAANHYAASTRSSTGGTPTPTSAPTQTPTPAPTATPTPAPTATPSPTPTATAVACAPPAFTNGVPYPTTWTPYNCTTSPFNRPVSANPTIASYSSQIIAIEFGSGNTQGVRNQEAGQWDYGHAIYYASASDPLVNLSCTQYCNHTDNGGYPTQIRIPAKARPAGGGDAHMAVIQPDGTEIDFWATTQTSTNWVNGSTVTAQAIANCGSFTNGPGYVPNGPAATAGGACLAAGMLRGSELASGHINHALFLVLQCAIGWVFPAFPNAATDNCTSGVGPPLGGRLWYDVPDATTNASTSLQPWEKAILNALHDYGGYLEDDVAGGANVSGVGFLAESTEDTYAFGQPDPFAALGWTGINVAGSLTVRYIGADPWTPSGVNFAAHMHWLAPCSAQGTC